MGRSAPRRDDHLGRIHMPEHNPRALALARDADAADASSVRRFATQTGLQVNTRALLWNVEAQRLWDLMNARGMALLWLSGRTLPSALGS
jgi:hypothetical protein